MMLKAVRTFAGVLDGSGLLLTYRTMGSIAQGETDFIAFKQSSLLFEATLSVFSLMKDVNYLSIPKEKRKWIARLIAYPLPFALQVLNHHIDVKKHPTIKKNIILFRKHLEHVAFIVDITVSALFTYYVARNYGAGLLTGLTIEILNEKKVLPQKVQNVWEKAWILISFTRLFNITLNDEVDYWDIAKFISEVSIFAYETYLEKPTKLPNRKLSLNLIDKVFTLPADKFRVNFSHVNSDPGLMISGANRIDIEIEMKKLADFVKWTPDTLIVWKRKMLKDLQFRTRYPKITEIKEIKDDFAISYFKKGLIEEASQIAHGSFKVGNSFIQFDVLKGMLKSVLKCLLDDVEGKKITAVNDALFKLALEGGDYCATGHVEAIESLYKERILLNKKVPLKSKVLFKLVAKRQHFFDVIYDRFAKLTYKLPKGLVDAGDIHFHNVSMFYFDRALKLHSQVVRNDMTTMEGGFCSRLYRFIFSKITDQIFWRYAVRSKKNYSVESILEDMNDLSLKDVTKYWKDWIQSCRRIESSKKEELMDDLEMYGKVFGEPLQIPTDSTGRNYATNPKLLQLMLYQMRIIDPLDK